MYIVYITTNTVTNKFYVGVHKQKDECFDGYLGSGKAIKESIKKHGSYNFKRETLYSTENREEAYLIEKLLVDHNSSETYNLKPGGKGGFHFINEHNIWSMDKITNCIKTLKERYGVDNPGKLESSRKAVIARNKLPKRKETIEKQKATLISSGKVKGENNPMFGRKGKLAPCYGRTGAKHPMFGRSHEKVTCPHCYKTGGKPGMVAFHFDKCKLKVVLCDDKVSNET